MTDELDVTTFGVGENLDYQHAQWLAIKMHGEWRFDHTAQQWHHWDGHRWAPDETGQIKHRVALLAAKACLPNGLASSIRSYARPSFFNTSFGGPS